MEKQRKLEEEMKKRVEDQAQKEEEIKRRQEEQERLKEIEDEKIQTDQELQKIEDVIKAQGEAQKINMEKGGWVYKVNKSVYEKLAKNSKFFL